VVFSRRKQAVRRLPDRFFFFCGGMVFLLGVLGKSCDWLWCFCGEFVVECVANVVSFRLFFGGWEWDRVLKFIFCGSADRSDGQMQGLSPFD